MDMTSNIYMEQLSSQYPICGLALWNPKPVENLHKQPGHVSIGDVGFLDHGAFMRIFNVNLPRDNPSNTTLIQLPEGYKPFESVPFISVYRGNVLQGEYYSHVSKVDNYCVHADTPDE